MVHQIGYNPINSAIINYAYYWITILDITLFSLFIEMTTWKRVVFVTLIQFDDYEQTFPETHAGLSKI